MENQQFHLRLPIDIYEWIKWIAKKNRRSMTAEIILALEAYRASREISKADLKSELMRE
jgi:hypothetical protein